MNVRVPLPVGIAAARAAASLSRLVGAGGGTTVPGKVISAIDPSALDRLARRLPLGCVLVSATNGKTTTAAMVREILSPRVRLAHNASGANLVSGVTSTLLAAKGAELGLFEVDEAALPEIARRARPRVVCLGNLFRDQLDRYGELEHLAERWRETARELPAEAILVVNGDDPQVGDLARERPGSLVFGLDDPRHSAAELQHAADSKWCLRCGQPYEYAAAYVGHLGDYRCPACGHGRPELDVVARDIELRGLDGVDFTLVAPDGELRVRLSVPGLYNVYNALAAASLAIALGTSLEDVGDGPRALRRRVRTVRADRGRGAQAPAAPRQESRGRERGDPDARRRRRAEAGGPGPQRRDRGRARRLVDLGRRLGAAARAASSGWS